jgi:murein DD-endopeptidase MepM/ murein hydrolase activator NlpD
MPPIKRSLLRRLLALTPIIMAGFFQTQCQTTSQPPQGEYLIQVQKGDTLAEIAHRFDTTPYSIAKANRLKLPIRLKVGDSLRIVPGKGRGNELHGPAADPSEFSNSDFPTISSPEEMEKKNQGKRAPGPQQPGKRVGLFFGSSLGPPEDNPDPSASDPLIEQDFLVESSPVRDELLALEPLRWPLRGSITSHFGNRRGHLHKGVDIKAPHGSAIVPAAEGKVLFAGRKKRYGNVVILQHRFHQTLYAHLSAIKVRGGEWVDLKRVIGHVGATGNARGTHLHFEVIDASLAVVDPVAVMTKSHSYRLARISGDRDLRSRSATRIQ